MRAFLAIGVVVGLVAQAAGCGDDSSFVDVHGRRRTLGQDAGDDSGMGVGQPGVRDGGGARDGALRDGEVPDGGFVDGGRVDGGVDLSRCQSADETFWESEVTFSDEGGFDLQAGPTGFGLAFMAEVVGQERIHVARIPSSGVIPEPHALFEQRPNSAKVLDAALLHDDGSWHVAWTDNSAGRVELMGMGLDAELDVASATDVERITDNDVVQVEKRPAMGRIAGKPYMTWTVEENRRPVAIWMTGLDSVSPVEVVAASSGRWPRRLALSRIGTDPAHEKGALAWVEPAEPGAQTGVWLQALDGTGAATGAPTKLSDKVSIGEAVSLASNSTGGAVAYSVAIGGTNKEVRFVRLDSNAKPSSGEIKIVGAPLQGTDAAIAALGQGYVVAYRALPGGAIAEPQIRLAFLTKEGIVSVDEAGQLLSVPVAKASLTSARISVQVSNEGQILVAWLDDVAGKKTLRLARRRLDCM